MSKFPELLREVYREHRGLFGLMVLLAVLSLIFLVFSLVNLNPSAANVNTGYGDIGSFSGEELVEMQNAGGYRAGKWSTMLTFPILAVIFGLMHNLVALKIYERRGEGIAKAFVVITIFLVMLAVITLVRLLGEG